MKLLRRAGTIRSLDKENRTATYVAATEGAVETWMGPEVLRMDGASLDRFQDNNVFLDSHNYEARKVIGSADVRVDKATRELIAEVTYAHGTEAADEIWSLVEQGHLRAVSVGFVPNRKRIRVLRDGETDGDGDSKVTGPARIVREWELVELSQVAVPADRHSLMRSYQDFYGNSKEARVKYPVSDDDVGEPGTPSPSQTRANSDTPNVIRFEELAAERSAREAKAEQQRREAIRGQVMAVCPESLRGAAEQALLEGLDFEGCRKRLIEAHAVKNPPVGTPEPSTPAARATEAPTTKPADVSDGDLLDGLKRAFGA